MNYKNIICIILIILIIYILVLITKKEHFVNKCYDNCKVREGSSLINVCPYKPECVGICINQHTYTNENIVNEILKNEDNIGEIKDDQTEADVLSTNCGICIDNFYTGLKLMDNYGKQCSQN